MAHDYRDDIQAAEDYYGPEVWAELAADLQQIPPSDPPSDAELEDMAQEAGMGDVPF